MTGISPDSYEIQSIDKTNPVLTPSEVGDWLNLSTGMVTLKTDLITRLISTAVDQVAFYTWLDLYRTVRIANYDLSPSGFFSLISGTMKLTLERSPIISLEDITKIEYLDIDGIWQEFDRGSLSSEGIYENVTEKKEKRGWSSIYFKEAISFDSSRINSYKVRITFTSGYTTPGDPTPIADPLTDVPEGLKQGLLMIVAYYFTNRGDCSSDCTIGGYPIPCAAKPIIDKYNISKSILGGSFNPWGSC